MNSLASENQHLKRLLSKKKSEFTKRKSASSHKTSSAESNEKISERDYNDRLVVNSKTVDESLTSGTSKKSSVALNGHRAESWRDLKPGQFYGLSV